MKNIFYKSVFGVGFIGEGSYDFKNHKKAYTVWNSMLKRCYSDKEHKINVAYKDCTVCIEWHNFQNFALWFYENYIEGFELDKDLKVKDNKIYSPLNCCFLHKNINNGLQTFKTKNDSLPIGVKKHGNKFRMQCRIENSYIFQKSFDTPKEAFDCYKITKESYIKRLAEKYKNLLPQETFLALINWYV